MNNILLIDDDRQLNTLLSLKLKGQGYHVQSAYDGEEAFDLYEKCIPDLIITDILMPGVDGLEFLLKIRDKHPDAHFKTLAMSGGGKISSKDYLNWMESLGAEGVMAKPFKLELFIEKVNQLLGHQTELDQNN
ncbi:MAG: response regulator [Bermanella sp.]